MLETNVLTQIELKAILDYSPTTGIFTNKVHRSHNARKGSVAGSTHSKGYVSIHLKGRKWFAHRLAWLYVYGVWPIAQIDHIDENKRNNAISNLREATNKENRQNQHSPLANSKTGLRGVHKHSQYNKYVAQIKCAGKTKHIGVFETLEAARMAYLQAKRALQPFSVTTKD